MSESLWVCSRWNTKPKDEEKHEVITSDNDYYFVHERNEHGRTCRRLMLFKPDYIPCPAPEQWERVEVALSAPDALSYRDIIVEGENVGIFRLPKRYRVVSLVVERRTA